MADVKRRVVDKDIVDLKDWMIKRFDILEENLRGEIKDSNEESQARINTLDMRMWGLTVGLLICLVSSLLSFVLR